MNAGHAVEREKGGKDATNLTEAEKQEMQNDVGFERARVDDEYVKAMKERQHEEIYVEQKPERLLFTNSCWEIQRVNPLQGGNMILDEVCRFRHVGTGKFLAVDEDRQQLTLKNSCMSLSCLFKIRSEMAQKSAVKFQDEDGDGAVDNVMMIKSGQNIIIQSYLDEQYLQL